MKKSEVRGSILAFSPRKKEKKRKEGEYISCSTTCKAHSYIRRHKGRNDEGNAIIAY